MQLKIYAWAAARMTGSVPSHVVIESIEDGRRGEVAVDAGMLEEAEAAIVHVR